VALRELLLIIIVSVLCCAALVRPRLGLYGYFWYAAMRPDVLAWSADAYPFSVALALATLIGSVRWWPSIRTLFQNPISRLLLLLQVPIGMSVLFAEEPSLSYDPYWNYARMIVMTLMIPLLIQTERHVREILLVVAFSLGFLGLKFGIYGLLHGGVIFVGGYGGMMSDNNLVAFALVLGVPLCWYSRSWVSSRLVRIILLAMAFISIAAVIMCNSRGASLSLLLALLLIMYRSRRKAVMLLWFVVSCGSAIYLVRDQYVARMATLQHYEEESSAASRIEFAKAALAMWKDYPVLGVGFGTKNFVRLSEPYLGRADVHVVHNSYLQMLVDSGIFALMLYVGLLAGVIIWLGSSVRRVRREHPGKEGIPMAIQTSLVAFLVGGAVYSVQHYDLPYILLMCAASWQIVQHSLALEGSSVDERSAERFDRIAPAQIPA